MSLNPTTLPPTSVSHAQFAGKSAAPNTSPTGVQPPDQFNKVSTPKFGENNQTEQANQKEEKGGGLGNAFGKGLKYSAVTAGAAVAQGIVGLFIHPLLITSVMTGLCVPLAGAVGFFKGLMSK
jgi:hypothetical protein